MRAGTKLVSEVTTTEVIVVRLPSRAVELSCAGAPLSETRASTVGPSDGSDGKAVLLGKRYVDEESGVELLCVSPGAGPLACDGRELVLKSAKPLPSSD